MYDVIVLGGGPSGVTAALRARELGASVALVERGRMGGTCTNDGCVPTRVLAKTARLLRDSALFREYGLEGERSSVDFERVLSRTQEIVYTIHEKKQLLEHLLEAGVEVFTERGPATFVDEYTISVGSPEPFTLQARSFIIAVGGHARRLNFPGAELALTHSDVWGLTALPRSVLVVGAAATGCQFASIFQAFGSDVTLLELAPRILPGEDKAVSTVMHEAFERHGMRVTTGIGGIDRIERADGRLRMVYRKDGEMVAAEADAVVLAVGWPANLEGLNLPAANIRTERGYIAVDDSLRTSVPHIFAVGDVTGRMMLVQTGSHDARVAAQNAVLGESRSFQHQIVPHGGFTDPEYGSVGLTEDQARAQEAVAVAVVPYAEIDRAVIDGRTEGLCKLVVSAESQRILGAHVVGEQALEVIQMVAAGMASGMTVQQLATLELAYPTYTAIVGLAARRIVKELAPGDAPAHWPALGKRVTVEWERRYSG